MTEQTMTTTSDRQSRPIPTTPHIVALLQTADAVRRHFNTLVKAEGLTLQQYNVLRILRDAGDAGLPTMLIGERMVELTPGLTRIVARLKTAGLVRRARNRSDKRQVVCRLTPAGLELLLRLDPAVSEAEEALCAVLPEVEHAQFAAMLSQLHGHVAGSPAE